MAKWNEILRIEEALGDRARFAGREPLRNLPRIKDLVADLTPFFEKWQKAGGRFAGTADRHAPMTSISPDEPRRRAVDAGIECINCAVCYSACDVVGWKADYLGPAALNRAWTLVNDDRHGERRVTLDKATADGGCHSCHTHASCLEHCPVGINPTRGIAGLKRLSLLRLREAARRQRPRAAVVVRCRRLPS